MQHGRLDEDLKDQAELEAVGAGQRCVAEGDVKNVLEGLAEMLPLLILRQRHVGDDVDEQGER